MKFYTGQHKFYCGVDLHARTMFLCVLDERGYPLLERNIKTDPEIFLKTIAPYREDLVVAVECMFTWYWLSDLCSREKIPFILGHALYMKAIHGGKAKNDRCAVGCSACSCRRSFPWRPSPEPGSTGRRHVERILFLDWDGTRAPMSF